MFIVQPDSNFGDFVCEELLSANGSQLQWHAFEFAVAWVNRSGAQKIREAARDFLVRGGDIRATVGLDFGSTTYEGLSSLLDLEGSGSVTTHVFCDENPACTFHPKVFLFSNAERAHLFVGSNNMTGAGLQTNVEATFRFSSALDNDAISVARRQLASWRTESDSRVRRLTRELLEELRNRKYVLTEDELRERRKSQSRPASSQERPLFGRSSLSRGKSDHRPGNRSRSKRAPRPTLGAVLLMRVRPRRNGGQFQISMKVLEASFMKGAKEVVSPDGARRAIGYNLATRTGSAQTVKNTARFEAPEMMGMKNPVARFRWIDIGRSSGNPEKVLQYEIFDAASSAEGVKILKSLQDGIVSPPVTNLEQLSQEQTVLSVREPSKAQWYRLD